MIHPFAHLRWEGDRHRVAEPTRQERRVRRLLAIAGRVHRSTGTRLDRFNGEARRLGTGEW